MGPRERNPTSAKKEKNMCIYRIFLTFGVKILFIKNLSDFFKLPLLILEEIFLGFFSGEKFLEEKCERDFSKKSRQTQFFGKISILKIFLSKNQIF